MTKVILFCIFLLTTNLNAQTALERSKAAYESLTPSQKKEVQEQILNDQQVYIRSKPLTQFGRGNNESGSLIFTKGLLCSEWNETNDIVKKSWLNQYFDLTSGKDKIPFNANSEQSLETVNSYCNKYTGHDIEKAFAAAYRKSEAEYLIRLDDNMRQAEERRKQLEQIRLLKISEIEQAEKIEAAESNNPIINTSINQLNCGDWLKKPPRILLQWMNQYIDLHSNGMQKVEREKFGLRIERLCYKYPSLSANIAHDYILKNTNANIISENSSKSNITWKKNFQTLGAKINVTSIDGININARTSSVELSPGFHSAEFTCTLGNGQSMQNSIDFIIKPNAIYAMGAMTNDGKKLESIVIMEPDAIHNSAIANYPSPSCSARLFECDGFLYFSKRQEKMLCATKKLSFFNTLKSDSFELIFD